MPGRTKAERKRAKTLTRRRQKVEAKQRRRKRKYSQKYSLKTKPKPGSWRKPETADIHRAIVTHLGTITRKLVKNVVQCRVTSPWQVNYSDLAFRNSQAFLEYRCIAIEGEKVSVAVQLISRTRQTTTGPRLPLWDDEYTFLLADPELFDKLSGVAAELTHFYYALVEYPNNGA